VDAAREVAFNVARKTMPNVAIGGLEVFIEQFMEVLQRSGDASV
jgi:hypothetical protein